MKSTTSFHGWKEVYIHEYFIIVTESPALAALVSYDGLGGYDWSNQAEDDLTNFLLMAYSSTSSNSEITDKCKTGLGYNAVPPLYTRNFLSLKPNLSGLEEFVNEPRVSEPTVKKLAVETSEVKASTDKPKDGNPQIDLHYKGVIESRCTRHMTGNVSNLTDSKEIDRGYVAFEGNPKGGKITERGGGLDAKKPWRILLLKLETTKTTQALEIDSLKRRVKKLKRRKRSRTHGLKRLYKVGLSTRVESSIDEGLGEGDASKQGRIDNIDENEDITLFSSHDEQMFDTNQDLGGEESSKKTEEKVTKGSSKRAGTKLEQESVKKQKIDDDKETTKLKQLVNIIPYEERIAIDAIPLAVKPPSIVDWKIHKEGKKTYYQIIMADESLKIYLILSHMLKDFDKEDMETLWKLVKAKYGSTRPKGDNERVL
nr:hypothetical protein [Tanacetum cinerariifolium]